MSAAPPGELEALDAYSRVVAGVAERLAPSVANLRVTRRMRGGHLPVGAGSGVVLTADGFVLTSAHVVPEPRSRGRAAFVDGRELAFTVVGRDPLSDLAVLRADADVSGAVSGVGDLDSPIGRVNVVLALREQLSGGAGQYGTAGSADAVSPPLPAAPQ